MWFACEFPFQTSQKGVPTQSSVAFCSPAKSLTFNGLMENPLVGKKLFSPNIPWQSAPKKGKTHTLKLQMESANLSSTTDESRVQLMSLEYDEVRLA